MITDGTGKKMFFHVKRDPLACVEGKEHKFEGWREHDDGKGGEQVCKHCGVGAMEYTMAASYDVEWF